MTDVHRELAIDDIWSVNIASITTVPLLVFLGILSDQQSNYRVIFLTGPPLKMSLDWPPP